MLNRQITDDGELAQMNTASQLGAHLRALRGGRTQQNIADHAKRVNVYLHRPDVSTIERGRRLPTENELRGFLHACGRADLIEALSAVRLNVQGDPAVPAARLKQPEQRVELPFPDDELRTPPAGSDQSGLPEHGGFEFERGGDVRTPSVHETVATERTQESAELGHVPADTGGPRATMTTAVVRNARCVMAMVGISAAVTAAAFLGPLPDRLSSDPPTLAAASPLQASEMPTPDCPTCISGGQTFTEHAAGDSLKPTFRDPRAFKDQGPPVQPGQQVEVVCRFHDPQAPLSVQPGWWYLIASPPWNRHYYTVANSYLNGDPPQGPPATDVDNGVPVC
jgi:hypothetical protein